MPYALRPIVSPPLALGYCVSSPGPRLTSTLHAALTPFCAQGGLGPPHPAAATGHLFVKCLSEILDFIVPNLALQFVCFGGAQLVGRPESIKLSYALKNKRRLH